MMTVMIVLMSSKLCVLNTNLLDFDGKCTQQGKRCLNISSFRFQ